MVKNLGTRMTNFSLVADPEINVHISLKLQLPNPASVP